VKWRKRGWRTSSGSPVEHKDLWEALLSLVENRNVEFIKVAGHADVHLNNAADTIARNIAETIQQELNLSERN